jgi:hypothetical protein
VSRTTHDDTLTGLFSNSLEDVPFLLESYSIQSSIDHRVAKNVIDQNPLLGCGGEEAGEKRRER